jgi:endonuclease YncB( thermonuclease family)
MYLQTINVKRVVDGDTIHARSGEKIRIIGMNAPELKLRPEPLALQARTEVTRFVEEATRLAMITGKNQYEQHDRILAHVYRVTAEGHIQSLAAHMLRKGFAFGIARSDHAEYWPCLKDMEQQARQNGENIWGEHLNHFITKKPRLGFAIVRSKVSRISRNEWEEIAHLVNGLKVRVLKKDLRHFSGGLGKYELKRVEVRGWMNAQRGSQFSYSMRVSHPDMFIIR